MAIKVAQDINVDDVTLNITDSFKLEANTTNSLGLSLHNADSISDLIALARAENKSIIDHRKLKIQVTDNISFRDLNVVLPNADFSLVQKGDGSFPFIELGGNSNIRENPYQEIGTVLRNTWVAKDLDPTKLTDHPSVIIVGAKNQTIKIKHVDYLRLELRNDTKSKSIGYSNFDFNFVQRLEITPTQDAMTDNTLWCNENYFNIRRLYGLDIFGAYQHNANIFNGSSLDYKNSYLNIQSSKSNQFLNFRMEVVASITFGEATEFNLLDASWYSNLLKLFDIGSTSYTLVDKGKFNRIMRVPDKHFDKTRVGYVTGIPLTNAKTWTEVYKTAKFEFNPTKDFIVCDWDNTNSTQFITVYCFDKQGNQIIPAQFTSPFLTARPNSNRLEGSYAGGQPYGTRYLQIDDPNVEMVQIGIGTSRDVSKALSTKFTVDLYHQGCRWVDTTAQP